eukprot:TRINITY_DN20053_c0_g1_i1.p1 TRINITY_DN20053_c0_g1~~TRINITY_DN20053_c0_g1_i1.p1  ORF type:complete len:1965 (+),score=335.49 TRINITY_DN20053_c0_g1_i1:55-5949(+)
MPRSSRVHPADSSIHSGSPLNTDAVSTVTTRSNIPLADDPATYRVEWNSKEDKSEKIKCFADGKEYAPMREDEYKVTGEYFTDIGFREREFVAVEAFLTEHPDNLLRHCGIIRETGNVGIQLLRKEVIYDAKVRRWVFSNKATPHPLELSPSKLQNRRDVPPAGIIRVVGELEFSSSQKAPQTVGSETFTIKGGQVRATKKQSIAFIQRQQETKEKEIKDYGGYEELVDSGEDDDVDETTGLGEAGDEDSSFMSDLEVAKHVKQYLSRAIPSLVTQSGMMAIHNGTGALAHQLSKGMAIFETLATNERNDEQGAENYHPGVCLCVVTYEEIHEVKQHFTHCILLSHQAPDKQGKTDGPKHPEQPLSPRLVNTQFEEDDEADHGASFRAPKRLPKDGRARAVMQRDETRKVTEKDIIDFVNRLVESLSTGYSVATDLKRVASGRKHPPARVQVPACSVLVGGGKMAHYALMQSVTRGDCVVVIEGSHGYADDLCSILDAVNDLNPNAGQDDFQKNLGTATAHTEKILMTSLAGKLVVIEKGTKVEEFQRRLHACLRGDEALVKAWSKYAQWKQNETIQCRVFNVFNILILSVSALATFSAVMLTFLLVLWKSQNKVFPESWKQSGPSEGEEVYYVLYVTLSWAIIGFPILLALLQAVNNKVNPGAKWVALRVASEDVLRQIYMYRTRTLDYSPEKCKEHNPASPGYKKPKDGLVYSTREELLSMRVNANTDTLSRSPVAGVALTKYCGALPPKEIRAHDCGFSILTPDDYIDLRVRVVRKALQEQSSEYQFKNNLITVLIHTFSGIGTCLAAIAANGFGYLQAWIAFTTAMVNSLQRYTDYSNLGRLHEQYNKTDNNLSNVEIWFAKLRELKDRSENQNQLVKRSEEYIKEEVDTWARLLQSAAEKLKEIDGETSTDEKNVEHKEKQEKEATALKEMGFEGLNPQAMKKAFSDPQGPEAKALYQSLTKISDELDIAPIPVKKSEPPPTETGTPAKPAPENNAKANASATEEGTASEEQTNATTLHDAHSVVSGLSAVPKQFADQISSQNAHQICELYVEHLTVSTSRCVSHQRLVKLLQVIPVLGETLEKLSQRECLESIKGVILFNILDNMFNGVKLKFVKPWEVVPSAEALEDFLNEINIVLVKTEGIDPNNPEMVLAQFRDESIRHRLTTMSRDTSKQLFLELEAILKATRDVTVENQDNKIDMTDKEAAQPQILALLFRLLGNLSKQLSELDIEAVMEDVEERIALWKELRDLPKSTLSSLETMNKRELLQILPQRFREIMKSKSVFQIATSIHQLLSGTPASRVFESLVSRLRKRIPELETQPFFTDPVSRERFVMACEAVDQKMINKRDKGELIRMLRVHPSFKSELADSLGFISQESFAVILSGILALFSNSYSGRIVDRLNDELSTFDVKYLLDVEDRDKLTSKIREFREVQGQLANMSKENLLTAIGYPQLQLKLKRLTKDQLEELIFTLAWIMRNRSQKRIWGRIINLSRYKKDSVFGSLSDEVVDHIFNYAVHLNLVFDKNNPSELVVPELDRFKNHDSPRELLHFIGDSLLSSELLHASPTPEASTIIDVLRKVAQTFGDSLVSDVYEIVGIGLQESGARAFHDIYATTFLTGFADNDPGLGDTQSNASLFKVTQQCREVLLNSIANFSLVEVTEIQQWDADTLREKLLPTDDENQTQKMKALIEVLETHAKDVVDVYSLLREVCWRLTSELTTTLPYRIFLRLCSLIDTFDVRGIITQMTNRYLLAFFVTYLTSEGVLTFNDETVEQTRKSLFAIMGRYPQFSSLAGVLRDFTMEQLSRLLWTTHNILVTQPGGKFLRNYLIKLMASGDDAWTKEKYMTNLGIRTLKVKMRTQHGRVRVKALFREWDAEAFVKIQDKESSLCQFLEDGELAETYIHMSAENLKLVFSHLRPLDDTLDVNQDEFGSDSDIAKELEEAHLFEAQYDTESEEEQY